MRHAVALIMVCMLFSAGCSILNTTSAATQVSKAKQAITQLSGVVSALGSLIQTSPLDDKTKASIATLVKAATTTLTNAAAATSTTGFDMSSVTAVITGVEQAVSSSSLDTSTKSQITNYVAWANVALQALGIVATVAGS